MKWFRRRPRIARYKTEKMSTQMRILRAHVAAQAGELSNIRHELATIVDRLRHMETFDLRERTATYEYRERVERALKEISR